MFLKKIIFFSLIIITLLFFYGIITDRPLGRDYKIVYLEPGCIIIGHKNGIYGDVKLFSISKKYIIGIINKPNKWMTKVIQKGLIKENPEGYFIIDKYNHTKKIKMQKNEFLDECKEREIENCSLKYSSGLDPVFDPYYWYVILMNKFD